jgi:hypothetical protein
MTPKSMTATELTLMAGARRPQRRHALRTRGASAVVLGRSTATNRALAHTFSALGYRGVVADPTVTELRKGPIESRRLASPSRSHE